MSLWASPGVPTPYHERSFSILSLPSERALWAPARYWNVANETRPQGVCSYLIGPRGGGGGVEQAKAKAAALVLCVRTLQLEEPQNQSSCGHAVHLYSYTSCPVSFVHKRG